MLAFQQNPLNDFLSSFTGWSWSQLLPATPYIPSGIIASITFRALIFAIEGFLPELLGYQVSLMFEVLSLLNLGPEPQPAKMSAAADKLQLFLAKRAIEDLDGTIDRTEALTARFTHEQLQQTFDGLESILKLLLIYTAATI